MLPVLQGLAVLAIVIAVGYVLARFRVLPDKSEEVLARLVFFVATPALMFQTLSHAPLDTVFSSALAVAATTAAVGVAGYLLVARLLWRRPLGESMIGAMAGSYVNAGNLGIPMSTYLFGTAAYVARVMMFQLIVFSPLAFVVLDLAATGRRPSLGRVVAQPVRNPIVLATMLGVLVAVVGWEPPAVVSRPIEMIAGLAVPGALIAFGMSLSGASLPGRDPRRRRELTAIVTLKLAALPLVAYLVGRFVFGMDGVPLLAATVCATLPSAQNIFVYAMRFGDGVALARDAVLATTLACLPALVVVVSLLHR